MALETSRASMHEHFLQVSEKSYGDCTGIQKSNSAAKSGSLDESGLNATAARRVALTALYTLTRPINTSTSVYILENVIIWLQVSHSI